MVFYIGSFRTGESGIPVSDGSHKQAQESFSPSQVQESFSPSQSTLFLNSMWREGLMACNQNQESHESLLPSENGDKTKPGKAAMTPAFPLLPCSICYFLPHILLNPSYRILWRGAGGCVLTKIWVSKEGRRGWACK